MTISKPYLIGAGVVLVLLIGLVIWQQDRYVEKVPPAVRMSLGMGIDVPTPQPAEWPDRVIPYAETPPSFVTPEFPPLPEAAPPAPKPTDWRPAFWAEHYRDRQ